MHVTDKDPAANRQNPIGERGFRPLNDRVLVRRLAEDEEVRIPRDIVLPDVCQKLSKYGIVVSVGPGKRGADGHRMPLDVKPGDLVEFGRYTDFDDGELVLIQEADIVGLVSLL